jgi:asparagine synthase (glutamine-hydrolysing)
MAEAVRCCLIEQPRDDSLNMRCFDDCNWTVSPALNFSAPDTERRNITLARKIGASAIVDGELGDNIFGSNVGVGALVECFRRHGIRRDFRAAAIDYAMLTRQSLWSTLVQTYREWTSLAANPDFSAAWEMRRRYTLGDARSMILASASAVEQHANTAYRFVHPWLQTSRQLAPGSYVLLLGIIMVTSSVYHSPFASPRDPPQISPLLAQPLLEIALQIPAYFHVKFGINRAVARIAFSGSLPAPILHRGTAKGGPHLWAKDVVENNVVYLRECLLDGILAQRGLLDRNKLEAVLSPRIEKSTAIVGDIFAKLYIETWLRKWQPLTLPRSVWRRAGT